MRLSWSNRLFYAWEIVPSSGHTRKDHIPDIIDLLREFDLDLILGRLEFYGPSLPFDGDGDLTALPV